MKMFLICLLLTVGVVKSKSQQMNQKLQEAFQVFESDSQMRNGIASLFITDGEENVVFEKNSRYGLAPASTQKIITAATAYEILGRNFRYKTFISFDRGIKANRLLGSLYIVGTGDPTLGSFRWKTTSDSQVLEKITVYLKDKGVNNIQGDIWINDLAFGMNPTPGGWIWEDMGNYYGAGSWGLNWRENQYDIIFQPSAEVGDAARLVSTRPYVYDFYLQNLVKTGAKGSGDNGYVYTMPYSRTGFVTGTIPQGQPTFSISGSLPQPARQLGFELINYLRYRKIEFNGKVKLYSDSILSQTGRRFIFNLDSIVSPSLDSMVYYFLQKSINLYGETFLKTISKEKSGMGETETGIEVMKEFWKGHGIPPSELNLADGSGLSPLNRVTTASQVKILLYARHQSWFDGFYNALPLYNGMKMKSGTINGVKGFCGYHTSKDGKQYVFSFLVNNYNGSAAAIVNKMYKVLDRLK